MLETTEIFFVKRKFTSLKNLIKVLIVFKPVAINGSYFELIRAKQLFSIIIPWSRDKCNLSIFPEIKE